MKLINNLYTILALTILLLSGAISSGKDKPSGDNEGRLESCPTLILALKVSSETSSDADDSLRISEWLNRNLQLKQSLWTMLQHETSVYRNKMVQPSFDLCRCYGRWYFVGTSFLLRQARHEAHRPNSPFDRDPFDSYFDYTNFLHRSSRSMPTADGRHIR